VSKRKTTKTEKPWEGAQVPDSMRARRSYPTVQWINRGGDLKPPQENGGFFAAQKYGNTSLPGGVEARFHQDDGSFSYGFEAAILAVRQAWFLKENGATVRLKRYQEGARKRVQALILIKGEDGQAVGPVKLTVVGLANEALPEAYWALNTVASGSDAQPWMFWVVLSAGETEEVGEHRQRMTPVLAKTPLADELADAFIGLDAVQRVVALADDIAVWREAWNGGGAVEDAASDDEGDLARAKSVRVNTKQYGNATLGDIVQKDLDYARELIEFIVDHPEQYKPNQTKAARIIKDALPKPETADEEAPM
jgi:hypothetical protein